jgi:hypothetical protein
MSSAPTQLAVPSLEDLYRMTGVPDKRVVISDVDWAFYEQLIDSLPPGAHIHVDYDGIIERLGDDDCYHQVEGSGFLPIRSDEVRR